MSDNEFAAYAAALIQTRGRLSSSGGKDKPNRPMLVIPCVERDLAQRLADHFGGRVIVSPATYDPDRMLYLWRVRGPTAIAVLEIVLPYLVGGIRSRAMYVLQRELERQGAGSHVA